MRTRHPSSVALLFFLLTLTAAGCRDSGAAGTTELVAAQAPAEPTVPLPNKDGSFKFGVLGDFGTGDQSQYELADQMTKLADRQRAAHASPRRRCALTTAFLERVGDVRPGCVEGGSETAQQSSDHGEDGEPKYRQLAASGPAEAGHYTGLRSQPPRSAHKGAR